VDELELAILLIASAFMATLFVDWVVPAIHREVLTVDEVAEDFERYVGGEVWVRGRLVGKVGVESEFEYYITIVVPVGKSLIPIPIYLFEDYNVYELSGANATITILTKENLDERIGEEVTVFGEVKEVKSKGGRVVGYAVLLHKITR